jgi:hypothetical protein
VAHHGWRLFGEGEPGGISSTSTLVTRSRTEEKLEVGTPSTCFVHHGVKLWNNTSMQGSERCQGKMGSKESSQRIHSWYANVIFIVVTKVVVT